MKTLLTLCCIGTFAICTAQQPDIDLEVFATGTDQPTTITNAGDNRLFVTEKEGTIRVINSDGTVNTVPFLDITNQVDPFFEQGLLGLAFHPDYINNGFFYVYYSTTISNDTFSRISRFKRDDTNPDIADNTSETILLSFEQPRGNHNGGNLAFGPDGMLYIGSGDGGKQGDPDGNAQDTSNLLGKILRIDVDLPAPYIPQDNPFAQTAGGEEIWAYGLRNPWKFSFDMESNELWIADVGNNVMEEVSKSATTASGVNYGWNCFEGTSTFSNNNCPNDVKPIITYDTGGPFGNSITGGYVYRGSQYPILTGRYIFGDFTRSAIYMTTNNGGTINSFTPTSASAGSYSTFGEANNKELYVANFNNGTIFKIIDNNVLSTPNFTKNGNTLFPNPSTNFFELKTSTPLEKILLFNVKGQLVKEFQFQADHLYNIATLKTGSYFLKITDQDGKEFQQKLIIQN